jgi:predicted porin
MRDVTEDNKNLTAARRRRQAVKVKMGLIMRILKHLLLASAAGLLAVSAAQAADLPTKKTPPVAAKPNCYATFMTWLDSTATDCPLTWVGITVYGAIDMGGGYETHASRFNKDYSNGVSELIAKTSGGARWQAVPNGLSQSNIGVKINEPIGDSPWAVVADVNMGFDPYSLQFANGPQSLVDNNGIAGGPGQSANADSSRAGLIDNTRAYIGLANKTFGTLTVGRQYAFSNDMANNYDPFGGSYAFSLIGTSATPVGGLGDTEDARYNTSVKYQVAYNGLRAGALWQFGNYTQENGSNGALQFDLGGDYAGFSVDAIYSHVNDAVFLSSLSAATLTAHPFAANDLGATIADIDSWAIAGKYKIGPFQAFAGYAYDRLTNPTDSYAINEAASGFNGIGGYTVPGNAAIAKNINLAAYVAAEALQTAWIGGKYAILSNLDFAAGYYEEWHNNYTGSTTTCAGATGNLANKACAGTLEAVSGMLDWRPWKRVDVYGGVMYSKASGGIANGYTHPNGTAWTDPNNTAFTTGVRVNF